MGNKPAVSLSEEQIEEYVFLTYLSRTEILYILKCFSGLGVGELQNNLYHRFHKLEIMDMFPALKYNPFSNRIFRVFSSYKDDRFSFEDMLDFCSAMSENCPDNVKAMWAFRIFDIDEDNQISSRDLFNIIDRLTYIKEDRTKFISVDEKQKILTTILKDMDLKIFGGLGEAEFGHIISKMPEFKNCFYLKI